MMNYKTKPMKGTRWYATVKPYFHFGLLGALTATLYACSKDNNLAVPAASLTELAGDIQLESRDTALTLRWENAQTTWEGSGHEKVRYNVEVSLDKDFQNSNLMAFTLETDSPFVHFNQEQLIPFQEYYARVQAIAGSNELRSSWINSAVFQIYDKLRDLDLLKAIKVHELTDQAAIIHWQNDEQHRVTHAVLSSEGEVVQEITLSTTDIAEGSKLIDGLQSNQQYTLALFSNERSAGEISFTTKQGLQDLSAMIDLRADQSSEALLQAVKTAAEGSTIVLARDAVYRVNSMLPISQSLTIMSEPGFGAPASLDFSGGGWTDIIAGSDIDHIVFNDLSINGTVESTYVMNIGNAGNVRSIVLENCLVSNQRGVVRVKTGPVNIEEISINNSVLTNIGGYGVINMDNDGAVGKKLRLSNSTVNGADLVLRSKTNGESIQLENVTFYDAPRSYVVDYGNATTNVIVRNCLFGAVSGANAIHAQGNALRELTNSYATRDFSGIAISGVKAYDKVSEQVFASPSTGDFTLIDEALSTVGDPRWR